MSFFCVSPHLPRCFSYLVRRRPKHTGAGLSLLLRLHRLTLSMGYTSCSASPATAAMGHSTPWPQTRSLFTPWLLTPGKRKGPQGEPRSGFPHADVRLHTRTGAGPRR